MKINEAKSIIDIVRDSSFGELFFTSLIILPIYLGSWVVVLKQVDKSLWGYNSLILLILILSYVLTLIVMKHYQSKDKKIENASIKIRQYILSRNWTRMSYERIQKNIDHSFNQELIDSILDKYPEDFRVGTIKGGKKAIVVLGEEE